MNIGLLGAVIALLLFSYFATRDQGRRDRLERKLDLILGHLGIESPGLSDRVKELAREPGRKIEAIKAYRDETGAGLKDAKDAVEDWVAAHP